MMVVRGTTPNTGNQAGFLPDDQYIVPAENCIWRQQDDAEGYSIVNVRYIHTDGNAQVLNNAVLGYIGKSGRFVAISN